MFSPTCQYDVHPSRSDHLTADAAVLQFLNLQLQLTALPALPKTPRKQHESVIGRTNQTIGVKFILVSMSCGHAYYNSLPHYCPAPGFSGSLMKSWSCL